jgi:NADH-quinone oxidoreductase subunit J
MEIAFYILSIIAVLSAVMVISLKNLVRAVLALASLFVSMAGLYLLLKAEFLALVQVLIYVGGVIVLFLFLIMLTEKVSSAGDFRVWSIVGAGIVLSLLYIMVSILKRFTLPISKSAPPSIKEIGELLMADYLIPFEAVSLLLLVALIGAIVIAKREAK